MTDQPVKRAKGFSIMCPFQEYPQQRENFFSKNPGCKVIEEIKTLTLAQMQMAPMEIPGMRSIQVPQQVTMIHWAIVYEESQIENGQVYAADVTDAAIQLSKIDFVKFAINARCKKFVDWVQSKKK